MELESITAAIYMLFALLFFVNAYNLMGKSKVLVAVNTILGIVLVCCVVQEWSQKQLTEAEFMELIRSGDMHSD